MISQLQEQLLFSERTRVLNAFRAGVSFSRGSFCHYVSSADMLFSGYAFGDEVSIAITVTYSFLLDHLECTITGFAGDVIEQSSFARLNCGCDV